MDLEAYFGQFGELADVYVHGKAPGQRQMKTK